MRKIPPPYTDPSYLFRHGGAAPPGMLDFSASINPLGPPASVLTAIQHALPDIARYPDPDCRELTARLATLHGVSPEQIVVGNGSNELIYAIARAFAPKRVAIAEPTYTEYLRASLAVGAEVDHWLAEGEDFFVEPFDPEGADIVWLCHPNNPTGQILGTVADSWIESSRPPLFVVDEAFLPLMISPYWKNFSVIPFLHHCPNLIVLHSMTKFYALPGIRLGYAVANEAIIRRIKSQLPPWSVNRLAQVAGLAAMEDESYFRQTRAMMRPRLEEFEVQFGNLLHHLRLVKPFACFFLIRLLEPRGPELTARLKERGILIRDASNFVGLDEHYVRISLQTREDNERLLTEMRAVLES